MMITESGYTRFKTFRVADSKFTDDHWMYQLTDPDTESLWEKGKLFPGTKLQDA